MTRIKLQAVIACGTILLAGCEKPTPPVPPVFVTVTPAIQQDVVATNQWVGLLDGFQNTDIQAQVTGYLLTQNYKEGSFVKKGALLFTIDPRPFQAALAQAQANYARSVAQAQLQQITLERQSQLYKTKVISQQEYDTSYQDTQAAIAAAAATQAQMQSAQVNLDYCTISAPFDGIAGVAQAQIGDLVGPGGKTAVLTQLSQVDPMKMNFSITEAEYLKAAPLLAELQAGKMAGEDGKIILTLADGSNYDKKGKFDFVNRQVSTSTGTIQITALFPNPDSVLRPGLFGRVTAPVQRLEGAILVPQAATVEIQGNYFVGILQPDNTVKGTPVKLGPVQGQLQVVQGALKAGDKVVVGGIEKARPGVKVIAKPYEAPAPAPVSPK
ncbi:MAG: efflux RND transporter periplasmic adaptor subunit [Verrucomicrobiaceae bacterium]|nr:MAG: efflux RND transporter periplasmic adaptor subunit [Verrucomicrobiaceae bacterium]